MGSQETVVPEQLITLANELDDRVGPDLDAARAAFEAADISGDKFSNAGVAMQLAYPGGREWAMADATSKRDELRTITDKVADTAKIWAGAEAQSTVVEI